MELHGAFRVDAIDLLGIQAYNPPPCEYDNLQRNLKMNSFSINQRRHLAASESADVLWATEML